MVSQPLWKFGSIKVLPILHWKEHTTSQKLKTMSRASMRLRHKLGYGKKTSDFQLLKCVDHWEGSNAYADSSLLTKHLLLSISFHEQNERTHHKNRYARPQLQASASDKAVQWHGSGSPKPTMVLRGLVSTVMCILCSFLTTIQQSMHSLLKPTSDPAHHPFSPKNHSWLLTAQWESLRKNRMNTCCWLTPTAP